MMRVQLAQYKSDGTLKAEYKMTQRIRKARDEQDLLFKTATHIEDWAGQLIKMNDSFGDKFQTPKGNRKRLPCSFSPTQKIAIRVYYGDDMQEECVMTTTDYTSSAVCEYRLTLKKLASGEGKQVLLSSFKLTHMLGQPIKFS